MAVIDSYPTSNDASQQRRIGDAYNEAVGQSFTGDGNKVTDVQWYGSKGGSGHTGGLVCKIYAHSGTFGTSSLPGSLLATSDAVNLSAFSTSSSLVSFPFSGAEQITLTNGTNYVATIERTSVTGSNLLILWGDNTSPTHSGNNCYYPVGGSWTAASGVDWIFYVNGTAPVTFIARPNPLQFQAVTRASYY